MRHRALTAIAVVNIFIGFAAVPDNLSGKNPFMHGMRNSVTYGARSGALILESKSMRAIYSDQMILFGGQVGWKLNHRWRVELHVMYGEVTGTDAYYIEDYGTTTEPRGIYYYPAQASSRHKRTVFNVVFTRYFSHSANQRVVPFAMGGSGVTRTDDRSDDIIYRGEWTDGLHYSENWPSAQIGGGLDINLGRGFSTQIGAAYMALGGRYYDLKYLRVFTLPGQGTFLHTYYNTGMDEKMGGLLAFLNISGTF